MVQTPTDEEIHALVEAVPGELEQYGIDVGPFTGIFIARDHRLPEKPDARGAYTIPLDTFSLYKPFFEQDEPIRPTVIHEYVHKDQWLDTQHIAITDRAYR